MLIPFFSLFFSFQIEAYGEEKIGWWWYEVSPPPKEKTDPKTQPMSLPKVTELWEMDADRFQETLTATLKKAVQTPSVENVKDYLTIQDIARRKAMAFANVASFVTQTVPGLSTEKDFPITNPGKLAVLTTEAQEIALKLNEEKNDFALLFFYSPTCDFCVAQNGVLQYFIDKYHWEIRPINILEQSDFAGKFNVRAVPYIILISRTSKDFLPISAGVISLMDLEERVFRSIRILKKEIKPNQYSLYDFERDGVFDPMSALGITEKK